MIRFSKFASNKKIKRSLKHFWRETISIKIGNFEFDTSHFKF